MRVVFLILFLMLPLPLSVHAEDLGALSANPFATDASRLLVRLSGFSGLSGSFG